MRYAHGILFGAIPPGIIFLGSAFIKLSGFGVTDEAVLQSIWQMYVTWVFVSILLIVIPLIVSFLRYRVHFKEIVAFEIGGLMFFSPFWFIFATEISGDPWLEVLLSGVSNSLPFIGPSGSLQGVSVGPIILIPSVVIMLLLGIFILRPSFVKSLSAVRPIPTVSLAGPPASGAPTGATEAIPSIAPPASPTSDKDELRSLLTELGVAPAHIEAIISAGILSTTDLVSTSPEQIAHITGMSPQEAANLSAEINKKLWFEGV